MKRIFSKKSGFTLVEIIVAFAIFAIMSTMILSMVDLTVKEKGKTNELANSIDEQTGYLTYHYIDDADKYDETAAADGAFSLNFVDESGNPVSSVSMDYAMRSSVDGTTNAGEGINYFVGNVDYTDPSTPAGSDPGSGDAIPGLGNSQSARYDTRLSGSKNIDYIQIYNVVKDTSYSVPGKSRYFIECAAKGTNADSEADGTVPGEDVAYLQYKLRFVSSTSYTESDGTAADGKTYTYKIYNDAKILECGYVNSTSLSWSDSACIDYRLYTPSSSASYNKYTVEPTSDSIVRIGIPLKDGYGSSAKSTFYQKGFQGSVFTRFYVVFEGDPQLTVSSFGNNGISGRYSAYPIYNDDGSESGDYNMNIYGAYPYEKTLKAGS